MKDFTEDILPRFPKRLPCLTLFNVCFCIYSTSVSNWRRKAHSKLSSAPIEWSYYDVECISCKDPCLYCEKIDTATKKDLKKGFEAVSPSCDVCKASNKDSLKRDPSYINVSRQAMKKLSKGQTTMTSYC